ncbi:MAG: zinc ribbon domain-containing protein, partial [Oscillospiraceae bacterium]
MKIKCDYCGSFIDDTDERCPNCGAVNSHLVRTADGVPKTIEELKSFCAAHNMPLEKMRFFIGRDFREPKAFGIFRDSHGNFVVYKNKADGSRSIRYEGPDEAYAVNEIFQKIRSEVQQRKNAQPQHNSGKAPQKRRQKLTGHSLAALIIFTAVVATLIVLSIASPAPSRGYYSY